MITRAEHKEKAKERLKKCKSGMIGANILSSFLMLATIVPYCVALWVLYLLMLCVVAIIGGAGMGAVGLLTDGSISAILASMAGATIIGMLFYCIVLMVVLQACYGVVEMGNNRYYLYTVKHGIKPSITSVLEGFNDFWNVFLTYARRECIVVLYWLPGIAMIVLGALLANSAPGASVFILALGYLEMVIAGWIARLQLWAVAWIKADQPELNGVRCVDESKKMCKGHLGELFILQLSFIPWILLNTITFGVVGLLYYVPYRRETEALIYQQLKGKGVDLNGIENAEAIRGSSTLESAANSVVDAVPQKVVVGVVVGLAGSFQGKRVEVTPGVPVVIGRSDNANIQIKGAGIADSVSNNHCTIRFNRDADVYEVTDTSSNGTFVNGQRLTKGVPVSLPCGVEITLADDRNKLRLEKRFR